MSDTTPKNQYNAIVIGGGPAGYVAAIKAAQLGLSAALVEKDEPGGTCLNRGCIPTKAYLKNAEIIEHIHAASSRGIHLADNTVQIDMPAVVKMKETIVKKLTRGVRSLLKGNKVEFIPGEGVLQADKTVLVNNKIKLKADTIIIAGGSQPSSIPVPGLDSDKVLDSTALLNLQSIPKHLAVIGGGVVGVEMALIFRSFGAQVSIIEMEKSVLSFFDDSLTEFAGNMLRKKGIDVYCGTRLESVEDSGAFLTLKMSSGKTLQADTALLAVGRKADLSALGNSGVAVEKNCVVVDDYLMTNIPGVYAAGDITGRKMLAHAAYKQGETAAENAAGGRHKANLRFVPSVVYSIPEIASVGLTEAEAKAKGSISTGFFPLSANGKALAAGESDGFVKVISDKTYGEVLGVHMAGPGASEIINEAAALMAMEITTEEIINIIHGHPTVGEAFVEASASCLNKALHLPPGM